MEQQQEIVTMYFNRGAFVSWVDSNELTLSCAVRFGVVECENSQRPGHYYVRNEHGDLELLHWSKLALTNRKK